MAWITNQVLLAGAGISPNNWKELVDLGVTAVVNMRSEYQDSFDAPYPFAYLWLPTGDFTNPPPEKLLMGAQLIDSLVKNNHKVLVHCKMGVHRSATMVVAYLIYTGMAREDAIFKLREKGLRLYGTDEDLETLSRYVEFLSR